jgi:hypothetical protein
VERTDNSVQYPGEKNAKYKTERTGDRPGQGNDRHFNKKYFL